VLDLPRALNAYQHARHTCGADGKRRLSAQAPQPEMFTLKEPLALHRRRRLHNGRHQPARTLGKIYAGKRLIDFEFPRLACLCVQHVPQSYRRNVTSLFR